MGKLGTSTIFQRKYLQKNYRGLKVDVDVFFLNDMKKVDILSFVVMSGISME